MVGNYFEVFLHKKYEFKMEKLLGRIKKPIIFTSELKGLHSNRN